MVVAFHKIRSWTNNHNHLAAFIFFLLLIGSVYFPVLIGYASLKTYGAWPSGPLFVGDPVAGGPITYPMEQLVARAWATLQLPLWNPYQAYGLTLGGNQGVAWFIPEILMHLLFPHHFSIWNVLRLVLMSQGAYLLARELDRSFFASVLIGLFYALAGPAIPNVNLGMDNTLLVFPYLLIAFRRLVVAKSRVDVIRWTALSALAVDCSFLAGFAEALPLQFLFALLFALSFVPFKSGGLRGAVIVVARGGASLVLGVLGSWISIYTLLLPLRSYFSNQSPNSYMTYVPFRWLATLVDPTFFGYALTAGRFTVGQTVWIMGNPVWAFFLIASALILVRQVQRKTRQPMWLFVSALTVMLGVMGYADMLGILRIFALPPFNLIAMFRFLEFAWWLPSCLVLGWAYDYISDIGSVARVVILVVLGFLLFLTVVHFAQEVQSTIPLGDLLAENVAFSVVFLALLLINLSSKKRFLQTGLLVLSLFSLILFVPKNYFQYGVPFQGIQTDKSSFPQKADILFFSNNDGNSVLFSGMRIHVISAFGPFYPSGYAHLIAGLFSDPNPTSPGGVLWLGNPTLFSLVLNEENLLRLRILGVTKIANFGPLQVALAENTSFLKAILKLRASQQSSFVGAVKALSGVYLSRPDLQNAFPYTSATLNQDLLNWALTYGTTSDSARTELSPYQKQYKVLSTISNTGNHLPPIVTPAESSLLGDPNMVQFAHGGRLYVYPLKDPQGLVFAPTHVSQHMSQSAFDGLLQSDPTQLLSTAFILRQGNSTDSSSIRRSMQNLRVAQLSYSPGFDHQTLRVRTRGQGLLVLRIQYTKHVVVTVNGAVVHPVPVDGLYTGLYVKSGVLSIRFNYVTPAVFWSAIISALITLALIVVAAACQWGRKWGIRPNVM